MVEGIIFEGDQQVGTFVVHVDKPEHDEAHGIRERVELKFPAGYRVAYSIEAATEAGTPFTLMVVPTE